MDINTTKISEEDLVLAGGDNDNGVSLMCYPDPGDSGGCTESGGEGGSSCPETGGWDDNYNCPETGGSGDDYNCPETNDPDSPCHTGGSSCPETNDPDSPCHNGDGSCPETGGGTGGSECEPVDPYIPEYNISSGEIIDITDCTTNIGYNYRIISDDETVAKITADGQIRGTGGGETTVSIVNEYNEVVTTKVVSVSQNKFSPVEEAEYEKPASSYQSDPIEVFSGAHVINMTLMSLFSGFGIKVDAKYNSTNLVSGDMGKGWYHSFEKRVDFYENDYYNCEAYFYITPTNYLKYYYDDSRGIFTSSSPGSEKYTINSYVEGYRFVFNYDNEYDEYYDHEGYLVKIVNKEGFVTHINHTDLCITVTDGTTGKSIYLERECWDGPISRIYDDNERSVYLYYEHGCLTSIRDVNGKYITYTYDEYGHVISGNDANGKRFFFNTYDKYGRVVSQLDGVGSTPTLFEYGSNGVRTTTDRNGKICTREYNSDGMLVRYIDPNNNTTCYEYDSKFNVIKETDDYGKSIETEYSDLNRPICRTDKNGNKTLFEYDTRANVTKIIYPDGSEEKFEYNKRNQVIWHTDRRNTTTVYTYDSKGYPESKKIGSRAPTKYYYSSYLGRLSYEIDPNGNKTTYSYNTYGQMTSKKDALGRTTSYSYDLLGNPTKTTDALRKYTMNYYDGNYQLIRSMDKNFNYTNYTYNANMKNTCITYPDGSTALFEYDGEDRVVKSIDRADNVTLTEYDDGGRVIKKTLPDGSFTTYEYDKVGRVVKETNALNASVTKTYDAVGNVLTVTDSEGNKSIFEYDSMSRVIRKVNAVSGTTVYEYSPAGDLISETNSMGHKVTYEYNETGKKKCVTDARGNSTHYEYDDCDNLISVTDAEGHTVKYTYDALNRVSTVTNAKGHTVSYTYDAIGRKTKVTDGNGNTVTTTYDANSNILKVTDGKGNIIKESTYNNFNLPTSVTNEFGVTTYTYNLLGKVETITDALGNTKTFSYNSRGMNTNVVDEAGNTSTAEYNVLGGVDSIAGPLGATTNYTYDTQGRLIEESTASWGSIRYTYNELGVKEELTNARGHKRKYFYDSLGRVTGYVGHEDSVSYTYDENGNVLTVTDKNGTITRTYDAMNRVKTCTDTFGKTVKYDYDAVGNLEKLTYPDNTAVTYTYDKNNNLTSVTDWAGRTTLYSYDANNRLVGEIKPNGCVSTLTYDSYGRLVSVNEINPSNVVFRSFNYQYDAMGRITQEENVAKSINLCYTYDELSRVTVTEKCDNGSCVSTESFTYDEAGNILSSVDGNGSISQVSYDTNNRITYFNGWDVWYDMDGNQRQLPLCNEHSHLEYDSKNRLISTGSISYSYNAEDYRTSKVRYGVETRYTYNTNSKLSQLMVETRDGVDIKYVYGVGLVGREKDGVFNYYHFDCRGSTVAITDEAGTVITEIEYDTYGRITSGYSAVTPYTFLYDGRDGVVTDEDELLYMRARYYSPELKRFINADIIPGEISSAITLNRFAYANGNPVSNIDPFGLSAERGGKYNISNMIYIPSENNLVISNAVLSYEELDIKIQLLALKPWGEPNSHANEFGTYRKERWYDFEGKAIKDRHYTDHGNPKQHPYNPHDQYWDWSDPEHPKFKEKQYPPSDSMTPPDDDDNSSDEHNKNSNENSSKNTIKNSNTNWLSIAGGTGLIILTGIGLTWVAGNDATGVGIIDDSLIPVLSGIFTKGLQLVGG